MSRSLLIAVVLLAIVVFAMVGSAFAAIPAPTATIATISAGPPTTTGMVATFARGPDVESAPTSVATPHPVARIGELTAFVDTNNTATASTRTTADTATTLKATARSTAPVAVDNTRALDTASTTATIGKDKVGIALSTGTTASTSSTTTIGDKTAALGRALSKIEMGLTGSANYVSATGRRMSSSVADQVSKLEESTISVRLTLVTF